MARNPKTPEVLTPDAPLDEAALQVASAQQAERMQAVMAQFGDGLPYDQERLIHETQFYMQQSAEAMLQAGRRLVVLKEATPHGEFADVVQVRLGLNIRAAQRMMQAAVKFSNPKLANASTSTHLIQAAGSKSKLFELMTLEDSDLEALAEGGTVANLVLDDIERMGISELRAALREQKENYAAQGELVAKRDAKIAELQTEVRKVKKRVKEAPADEVAAELQQEVSRLAYLAEAAVRGDFFLGVQALIQHYTHDVSGDPRPMIAGFLVQIERAVNEIYAEFDIPRELASTTNPDLGFGQD